MVNVSVTANTLTNNDIGVALFNADPSCSYAPTTKTKDSATNNTITNSDVSNVSGNGDGCGYQAGISDLGNGDSLQNNKISGAGYTHATCPAGGPGTDIFATDTTGTSVVRIHNHTTP